MTKSIASASVVRAAFKAGDFKPTEGVSLDSLTGKDGSGIVRGRIHPAHVEAFLASPAGANFRAADKGETQPRAQATVEVPRSSTDSKGRVRALKPVTLPVSEVRALAGKPDSKGRLSKDMLAAAGAAHVAANRKSRKR